MASWTLSVALCLAMCLAFVGYSEGQAKFPCNIPEVEECKKYAGNRIYVDCKHFYQYDCNPYCSYVHPNGDKSAETHCSPDNQKCRLGNNLWGKCNYAQCACIFKYPPS